MTELINKIDETFNFNENTIRVLGTFNNPWFVAKDITNILGLTNITEALRTIPETWRSAELVICANGQNMNMITINESAVYKLIMRSNKKIAQKFQEVVCGEILPSIRKTGEFQLKQLLDVKNELELKNQEQQKLLQERQDEVEKLTKKYIKPPKQVFEDKNVVYLMTAEGGADTIGTCCVGKATNLNNRKDHYDNNKIYNFRVVYYVACNSVKLMDFLEPIVLMKLSKYKCKAGRDVFQLPPSENISLFINIFDECINFFEGIDDSEVLVVNRTIDKEKRKEDKALYYKEHREEIIANVTDYYNDNKEVIAEYKKLHYEKNIDKYAETNKKYYEENKTEYIANVMEHYHENKEQILEERLELLKFLLINEIHFIYKLT